MNDLTLRYDVTARDLARGRNLKVGAIAAPFVLGGLPLAATLALTILFGATPPTAAVILFIGLIISFIGLLAGVGLSGFLTYKRSNWTKEMRERIAADGIRANEIEWFRHELKHNERRSLKEISARDLLLADAYRETLASRLTATRISRSSKRELDLMKRRLTKLKQLKSASSEEFQKELARDIGKIENINTEAKVMLSEAETRLQMIEAASVRGGSIADSELALKKLSARAAELPLALEEAKMAEEIRAELEKESPY